MSDHLMDNEDQLQGKWKPIEEADLPTSTSPAMLIPHDVPPLFSGSLSPYIQHDSSFVGTQVGKSRIPSNSLMPFGPQNNPQNAAAAQTVVNESSGGGGTTKVPFSDITTGVNSGQLLQVAGYSTLTYATTGTINSNEIGGIDVAGNAPDHPGQLLISQPGNASALWMDPQVQGLYPAGADIDSPPAYEAPTTVQPVLIGGRDPEGLLQDINVDDDGNIIISTTPKNVETSMLQTQKEILHQLKVITLILMSFCANDTKVPTDFSDVSGI
jgi:hypothetical protein